jgi:hypothetical protein
LRAAEALKIKAFLEMHRKKAKLKVYINQQLMIAMGFVARVASFWSSCAVQQKICA